MNIHVLLAVFRRNFVSYFSTPTGYLFICVFVLLCALAAYFPVDFFNNNLANLDQLSWGIQFLGFSFGFPLIMLAFIPAVTMGIWAEERKQGTDELLLTISAGDFDIVLGKYLAAVAIFTVALVFSLVSNLLVLSWLGNPDIGLFLGTYAGYWLIGLAMLAVGMTASFLTSNLTIAFILGAVFNAPLVFGGAAGTVFGPRLAAWAKRWSLQQQFSDFGHGVLSLAALLYFLVIVVVMLYVSMILIGRRHWFTGRERWNQVGHFLVRSLALVVIGMGLVHVFQQRDVRCDVTSEKLSSLSPQTVELIRQLKVDHPVVIDAFISPVVPEAYVQTRLNLLTVLRELESLGGASLQVNLYDTERFSKEAALAKRRYNIEPRQVTTLTQGAISMESIYMNVAVSCGADRKTAPVFIDRGIPVEYELIRSICTVAEQKRKRLGVLNTDAQLFGSINYQTMSPTPDWPIIEELEKQYDVVKVDPSKPITETYDVLLAVQPSSLGPSEMENFIAAVRNGQPTAIFEDPAPVAGMGIPATSAPRNSPAGMNMFMRQPPPPKGDISKLWKLLGVNFDPQKIVWQSYNPYPKATHFPREFVFIDKSCGAKQPFNPKDPVSSGLQQVLFLFPGSVDKLNASDLHFTPLASTGNQTGEVMFRDLMQMTPFGPRGLNPDRRMIPTNQPYVLAARIEGDVKIAPSDEPSAKTDAGKKQDAAGDKSDAPKTARLNVILVTDVDMLSPEFFRLREQGNVPEAGFYFNFDNVTFILNVLDALADEPRFIDIRGRRPKHRTLSRIEKSTEEAKQKAIDARKEFTDKYEEEEKRQQKIFDDKIAELNQRKDIDPTRKVIELALMQQQLEREKEIRLKQARDEKDGKIEECETELNLEIKRVQGQYKLWAVLLPPIPPLLVALAVFFTRRAREREGVARSRLR